MWFLMLVIVIFVLYSTAIAIAGQDDCGDAGMSWQFFPPEWECDTKPGFG
jgi:hypothetical protein